MASKWSLSFRLMSENDVGPMESARQLRLEIIAFHPFDEREAADCRETCRYLGTTEAAFDRGNGGGHITASAVVTDSLYRTMLLVYNAKLGIWLQPGGHVEPDVDASTQSAAYRELIEETHVTVKLAKRDGIFGVGRHLIPEFDAFPRHFHYDIRYLFVAEGTCATNRRFVRWVPVDEIARNRTYSRQSDLKHLATKLINARRSSCQAS